MYGNGTNSLKKQVIDHYSKVFARRFEERIKKNLKSPEIRKRREVLEKKSKLGSKQAKKLLDREFERERKRVERCLKRQQENLNRQPKGFESTKEKETEADIEITNLIKNRALEIYNRNVKSGKRFKPMRYKQMSTHVEKEVEEEIAHEEQRALKGKVITVRRRKVIRKKDIGG